jgi:hypothetical protein
MMQKVRDTRRALLDAATEAVSKDGLDGTSLRAICARRHGAALADLDEDLFDELLAVNLKGVWLPYAPRSGPRSPPAVPVRSSTPAVSAACVPVPA